MSESVTSAMATRCVACLILGYVLLVSQPTAQTRASPLFEVNGSVRNFTSKVINGTRNFTNKVINGTSNLTSKVINGTKNFLGLTPESSTISPPTTTTSSFHLVIIPKEFSKNIYNVSENGRTINSTNLLPNLPNPEKPCSGFSQRVKCALGKATSFLGWSTPTTTPRPKPVWIVPVSWKIFAATASPCQRGNNGSGHQGCMSSTQVAGSSWWMLALSVVGALGMGVGAWKVFTRSRSLGTVVEGGSVKVRTAKSPWLCFGSEPDPLTSSRDPIPQPPAPLAPQVKKPPSWPVPAVPVPAPFHASPRAPVHVPVHAPVGDRANSMYHAPPGPPNHATPRPPSHVYATPTPRAYTGWSSNASEHVHVYEIPPCFPVFDLAEQEIDTTTLQNSKQARC